MSELVDDRISKINFDDRGSEIESRVPRFSYAYDRLGGILFGGIFVGSGIGVSIAGAPFIFPLLFVPIGSIIMLVSLRNYLTAIRTVVSKKGIFYQSSLIGIWKQEKDMSINNFKEFTIKSASTWQSNSGTARHFFAIQASDNSGKSIVIVDKVEGQETADALVEKFERLIYQ